MDYFSSLELPQIVLLYGSKQIYSELFTGIPNLIHTPAGDKGSSLRSDAHTLTDLLKFTHHLLDDKQKEMIGFGRSAYNYNTSI